MCTLNILYTTFIFSENSEKKLLFRINIFRNFRKIWCICYKFSEISEKIANKKQKQNWKFCKKQKILKHNFKNNKYEKNKRYILKYKMYILKNKNKHKINCTDKFVGKISNFPYNRETTERVSYGC